MSNKIPCGGFKLDNNFLGMNENDELSLTSGSEGEGKAYKQLVTDGTGTAKWEDRLAYGDSKVAVSLEDGTQFVHVSDDIGELNATDGAKLYLTIDDGSLAGSAKTDTLHGAGDLLSGQYCLIALTDNIVMGNYVFPKRGVYLYKSDSSFVSSVANFVESANETDPLPEPVITWDGSMGDLKKIDKKYIGLLAFPVYTDGMGNFSTTVSYDEVRKAYNERTPIFAKLISSVDGEQYGRTSEIRADDTGIYIHFASSNAGESIKYSSDGTLTAYGVS